MQDHLEFKATNPEQLNLESLQRVNQFQLFNGDFDCSMSGHLSKDLVLNGDQYDTAGYDNDDLESSDDSQEHKRQDYDTASGLSAFHYHATLEDSGDEAKDKDGKNFFESEESMSCSSASSTDPSEQTKPH